MTVYSIDPIFSIKSGKIVGRLRRTGNLTWASQIHVTTPCPTPHPPPPPEGHNQPEAAPNTSQIFGRVNLFAKAPQPQVGVRKDKAGVRRKEELKWMTKPKKIKESPGSHSSGVTDMMASFTTWLGTPGAPISRLPRFLTIPRPG